jgi:hypothetical protein
MKSIQAISRCSNQVLSIASVFLIAAGTSGCGMFGSSDAKHPMTASIENTSGQGTLEAKRGDNGNTDIEVLVKHLSSPSKIASDASVYVVWLQPLNAEIQNLGALKVDENLAGTFNTTTPHRSFKLSITPEPSARMSEPSHDAVFTSEVALNDE